MKFNNKPNKNIITDEGDEHWLSRSVAVTVSVLVIHEDTPYILVNQRGPGVPNKVGYWNLVCGYLDYNETIQEAAIREVWEECGVNALELIEVCEAVFFDPPWDVHSQPGMNAQNVTTHHGIVAKVEQLPELTNAYNEPDETIDIRWLPLSHVINFEFAFNHHLQIKKFIEHVANKTAYDFTEHFGE